MASYRQIPPSNKQGYKWVCTLEGPPDPATGKRRQIPRSGDTKKEAFKHANALLKNLQDHGIVSMLAEAGVDLKTIMQRVGHDDPDTTLRIYTHVTEKMRKDANERIRIHFADILNFNFNNIDSTPDPILQEM